MSVSIQGTLAAACVLVVGTAAVLPGWYRENWIWENPVQASAGASAAVAATAASLFVASQARRGRIAPRISVAFGSALLAVVVLGALLFISAGAAVVPVPVEV